MEQFGWPWWRSERAEKALETWPDSRSEPNMQCWISCRWFSSRNILCFPHWLQSHMEDGMCRLGIYKRFEQQLVLNNNHKYYYQIQQQLFCAKRSICCFIVSNARGTHRDTVQFDSAFWENILPRLESFYFDYVFPELVYPRILTGESRWNKDLQFPRLA